MAEPNPYAAPQITEQIVKTTVAPVNRRQRQHPWEEPLRTKLATIARHQRAMLRYTAILAVATVACGYWAMTQQRNFPQSVSEWLILGLLSPVVLLLMFTVYRLTTMLEDADSPVFLALAAAVPGFNVLLVFYIDNLAKQYLRESGIASGWIGISDEQFAAQVQLLRDAEQGKQSGGGLPVAELL
jgi:hypothetical protein